MNLTKPWHKIAAIIATLVFGLMAAIQLNDPDPLYWFLVYAAVAVIAGALIAARSGALAADPTFRLDQPHAAHGGQFDR